MSSFFSIDSISSIKSLRDGARIHLVAISGVAMAQLGLHLVKEGYLVSGSDKEFYPPMGLLLKEAEIKLYQGYSSTNIGNDVELVIIGNAVTSDNPEVVEVERRNLAYSIFPLALAETVIDDRHSIVVTGTHGKSTTSALSAWSLDRLGQHPSFFIGGVVKGFNSSFTVDNLGKVSVVEGDEYHSAFLARVPKFLFYKAQTAIITSIEYDHADVYPNLESIKDEFNKLVEQLSQREEKGEAKGNLVVCIDDPTLKDLVNKWRSKLTLTVITYGKSDQADFVLLDAVDELEQQKITFRDPSGALHSFILPIPGIYNALNALAAGIAISKTGISFNDALSALKDFQGVKRRQELRAQSRGSLLIEDFAHHPTAVSETIAGIRKRYPKHRLVAIFEPRSASSRKKVFQHDYIKAFQGADRVIIAKPAVRGNEGELIDIPTLVEELKILGADAHCFEDSEKIFQFLINNTKSGDLLLVMSNGSFDGLIDKLEQFISVS
jgi:UDP-N-acetylmuramate: L-alanyl-gamma-D-glutamyl-meso-diaminopimelate ligase